jgi:hypothetical protein
MAILILDIRATRKQDEKPNKAWEGTSVPIAELTKIREKLCQYLRLPLAKWL